MRAVLGWLGIRSKPGKKKKKKKKKKKEPPRPAHVAGIPSAAADALNAARPIVQFAVANLDPEIVRGWPYRELLQFVEALAEITDSVYDKEWAIDMRSFAARCAQLERLRAEGRQKELERAPRS